MDVDANLYEFLKDRETGIAEEDYDIVLYVHIPFYRLDEFVEIIGTHHFEEGGANVLMFDNTICFELNDVIEGLGHKMTSYKNCFVASEFERYEEKLREVEE